MAMSTTNHLLLPQMWQVSLRNMNVFTDVLSTSLREISNLRACALYFHLAMCCITAKNQTALKKPVRPKAPPATGIID